MSGPLWCAGGKSGGTGQDTPCWRYTGMAPTAPAG
ncbi:hypothetical protein GBAR_LOCUS27899 [Geodia barretti]|uniref:Uncharacterized protein n=1 Tax=Geodia barretti TaxID=519541 RepID=A0AA35TMR4_GEOBA|nr:hypothetical protein GBAR_LOCUS27899 [Geodia barretti]